MLFNVAVQWLFLIYLVHEIYVCCVVLNMLLVMLVLGTMLMVLFVGDDDDRTVTVSCNDGDGMLPMMMVFW